MRSIVIGLSTVLRHKIHMIVIAGYDKTKKNQENKKENQKKINTKREQTVRTKA